MDTAHLHAGLRFFLVLLFPVLIARKTRAEGADAAAHLAGNSTDASNTEEQNDNDENDDEFSRPKSEWHGITPKATDVNWSEMMRSITGKIKKLDLFPGTNCY